MKSKYVHVFLALLSLTLISQAALAQLGGLTIGKPVNEFEYVHLNGLGKVVGGKTYYCNGAQTQWGVKGVFQEVLITPCQ